MKITVKSFGKLGEKLFVLENTQGTILELSNYGGRVVRWLVKDQKQELTNIVLGFADSDDYRKAGAYFGATIGRVAGRLANGRFPQGDKVSQLNQNEGKNTLHGGAASFETKIWQTELVEGTDYLKVIFTYHSPDGENGFPGNLVAVVSHTLTNQNEWLIDYQGKTDQQTLYNPTNHVYFNLNKRQTKSVGSHYLYLASQEYLVIDEESLPTGEIRSVQGTTFDFTAKEGRLIQSSFDSQAQQNRLVDGIDHPFILNQATDYQASLYEPSTKIKIGMQTTAPAVVVYTTNIGEDRLPINPEAVGKHTGITLETQILPDVFSHPQFGSILLEKNQIFRSQTSYTVL